jgi:hypothetical protein
MKSCEVIDDIIGMMREDPATLKKYGITKGEGSSVDSGVEDDDSLEKEEESK